MPDKPSRANPKRRNVHDRAPSRRGSVRLQPQLLSQTQSRRLAQRKKAAFPFSRGRPRRTHCTDVTRLSRHGAAGGERRRPYTGAPQYDASRITRHDDETNAYSARRHRTYACADVVLSYHQVPCTRSNPFVRLRVLVKRKRTLSDQYGSMHNRVEYTVDRETSFEYVENIFCLTNELAHSTNSHKNCRQTRRCHKQKLDGPFDRLQGALRIHRGATRTRARGGRPRIAVGLPYPPANPFAAATASCAPQWSAATAADG